MSLRSPTPVHNYWGNTFAAYAQLPNVAGATIQTANVEVGDTAYVPSDDMMYFCTVATLGAAVWSAMGLVPSGPNFDAFGRLRVSNPETIFEAKTVYDPQPLYFAERQTGGAAPGSWVANNASVTLTVAANQTSTRQSRRYLNYQPGKSQLIFITFNLGGIEANTEKRAGYFDDDNGFFLELSGGVASFNRRSTSSTTTPPVPQASWNLDTMDGSGPSGVTLNFSDVQILVIDFEWLGVGSARMGFVIAGQIIYAHRFDCANVDQAVYMSTPNLPVRWEVEGLAGLVGTASVECICASVNSEGGVQAAGTQYAYVMPALTGNIGSGATTTLFSIRHNAAFTRVTIIPINVSPVALNNGISTWELVYNPALAGATWGATNTYLDLDITGTATGGTVLEAGSFTNAIGAQNLNLRDTTLTLGADVAGVSDVISLRVTNLSGGNERYIGSLAWIAVT